jgi:hypothetical protein
MLKSEWQTVVWKLGVVNIFRAAKQWPVKLLTGGTLEYMDELLMAKNHLIYRQLWLNFD